MPDEKTPDEKTPEEKTPEEKAEERPKAQGHGTLILRYQDAAEHRAEKRRGEERERDAVQEAQKDKWADKALAAESKRADDAQSELSAQKGGFDKLNKSRDKRERFQWLVMIILVLAVIGLAGYKVAGNLLGFGEIGIGGDAPEASTPAPAPEEE